MKEIRRLGIAAFVLLGIAVVLRLGIAFSASESQFSAEISGALLGLAGGAVLCWSIYALIMAPAGTLLTTLTKSHPEATVFVVATDTHLDSALTDLGFARTHRSRFIGLTADPCGVQLLDGRGRAPVADFAWAEIDRFWVGSASSRWSATSWSNVVMRVHLGQEGVNVPLSIMPGRTAGNYTPAQMRGVIDAIVSRRPERP